MDLNLQVTTQTKILIGVLGLVLIVAVAIQWGPGLYALINDPDMETKLKTLETSKDLVAASKILKPIESDLFQKAGLIKDEENKHIFEDSFPEIVIREKIDAIVKKAGIPPNYQVNMEAVPGKKSEQASPQARRNLVVYLYQKKLETERDTVKAEIQAESEAAEQAGIEAEMETMDMLMDAWLNETDEDAEEESKENEETDEYQDNGKIDESKIDEKSNKKNNGNSDEKRASEEAEEHKVDEKLDRTENDSENLDKVTPEKDTETSETPREVYDGQSDSANSTDSESQWEFASFPDSIPKYVQVELIELILSMTEQHLVGVENTLFDNQYYKTQKEGSTGFLGIGAKEPITEINFRPNSQILTKFRQLIDTPDENLDERKLTAELLEYLERIQSQLTELSEKLLMAPTSYSPESYTIKIKFKTEMDKMVNFNRLIETSSKWLRVRDLKISVDKKENKMNVDVLMIARVYQ